MSLSAIPSRLSGTFVTFGPAMNAALTLLSIRCRLSSIATAFSVAAVAATLPWRHASSGRRHQVVSLRHL